MISIAKLEVDPVCEVKLLSAALGLLNHVFSDVDSNDLAALGLSEKARVAACSTTHHQDITVLPDFAELSKPIDGSNAPNIEEWDIHVAHEIVIDQFFKFFYRQTVFSHGSDPISLSRLRSTGARFNNNLEYS